MDEKEFACAPIVSQTLSLSRPIQFDVGLHHL